MLGPFICCACARPLGCVTAPSRWVSEIAANRWWCVNPKGAGLSDKTRTAHLPNMIGDILGFYSVAEWLSTPSLFVFCLFLSLYHYSPRSASFSPIFCRFHPFPHSIETKWQSPWTFTAGGTLPSSKSSRLEPLILEFAGQTLGRTWSPVTEARHTPSRALRLTVDKTVLISSRDEGASFNSKLFCHLQALVQRKTKVRSRKLVSA